MTRTAKILIYLNLALCLAFAFWAIGLYTNHVDWTDNTKEGKGVFAQRSERIKALGEARIRADARFQAAKTAVAGEEKVRPEFQAWYDNEIQSLRTGKGVPQDPEYVNGEMKLDQKGQPAMGLVRKADKKELPGLGSLATLDKAYQDLQKQIRDVVAEIDKLVEEQKNLTTQIGDGRAAGLRKVLAAEQVEVKKSQDEQEFIEPLLYNRLVELKLLKKRQSALEARLKELGVERVAQKP
jgi:hypothetical protein